MELPEDPQEEQSTEGTEEMTVETAPGKFDKLLGENSRKFKLSGMFKDWFLDYSSYVILYRAVPHIVDGMKPVQRRVLHAMWKIDDGRYTKVANIVGQAMQYHPHGDQSILGALVQLGQKNYLIDCQETGVISLQVTQMLLPVILKHALQNSPRKSYSIRRLPTG